MKKFNPSTSSQVQTSRRLDFNFNKRSGSSILLILGILSLFVTPQITLANTGNDFNLMNMLFGQKPAQKQEPQEKNIEEQKSVAAKTQQQTNTAGEAKPVAVKKGVELKKGLELEKYFENITVLDTKNRQRKLNDLLSSRKGSMILMVKPGCVFCESLLTTMIEGNTKTDQKLFVLMDKNHASFEAFKKKYEQNKKIKAEWIYDLQNKFHEEFDVSSYPRILVLDKNLKLMVQQIGLVMPKNQKSLDKMEFPMVLKTLSENTVDWMKGL